MCCSIHSSSNRKSIIQLWLIFKVARLKTYIASNRLSNRRTWKKKHGKLNMVLKLIRIKIQFILIVCLFVKKKASEQQRRNIWRRLVGFTVVNIDVIFVLRNCTSSHIFFEVISVVCVCDETSAISLPLSFSFNSKFIYRAHISSFAQRTWIIVGRIWTLVRAPFMNYSFFLSLSRYIIRSNPWSAILQQPKNMASSKSIHNGNISLRKKF